MRKVPSTQGIVLIEFLLVATLLVMIVFMGIQFGLLMHRAQFTGEAARVAAKEASTRPGALTLPAGAAALYIDPGVFDERFTVIDLANLRFPTGAPLTDQDGDSDVDLEDQFRVLPAVHRTLRAQMVSDTTTLPGRNLLRFHGVLLRNPAAAFDLVVRVPDVAGGSAALRRVIHPPASLPADGLVEMQCWQWFQFSTWLLGGSGVPDPLAYSNIPAGYSVIRLDVEAGSRQGLALQSFGVARKEIQ